jgi:predicted transcriptional regulator
MFGTAPSAARLFKSAIWHLKVGCPGATPDQQTDGVVRYVRLHEISRVRVLAKDLERDYSNVHADVQAMTAAGLLDASGIGVRADYDAIETNVAI